MKIKLLEHIEGKWTGKRAPIALSINSLNLEASGEFVPISHYFSEGYKTSLTFTMLHHVKMDAPEQGQLQAKAKETFLRAIAHEYFRPIADELQAIVIDGLASRDVDAVLNKLQDSIDRLRGKETFI